MRYMRMLRAVKVIREVRRRVIRARLTKALMRLWGVCFCGGVAGIVGGDDDD